MEELSVFSRTETSSHWSVGFLTVRHIQAAVLKYNESTMNIALTLHSNGAFRKLRSGPWKYMLLLETCTDSLGENFPVSTRSAISIHGRQHHSRQQIIPCAPRRRRRSRRGEKEPKGFGARCHGLVDVWILELDLLL